jgi:hypothetical protein
VKLAGFGEKSLILHSNLQFYENQDVKEKQD